MNISRKHFPLLFAASLILGACADTDDTATGGGAAPLTYKGKSTPAEITYDNGPEIADGALSSTQGGAQLSGFAQKSGTSGGAVDSQLMVSTAKNIADKLLLSGNAFAVKNETFTEAGACGGTVSGSMRYDDAQVPTVDTVMSVNFSNFCDYDSQNQQEKYNGGFTLTFAKDESFIAVEFNNFSFSSATESFRANGSLKVTQTASLEKLEMNLVADAGNSSEVYKFENFVFTIQQVSGGENISFDGAFYLAQYGRIEFDTQTPFFIQSGRQNPTSGVLVITGANNGTITITANSDGATYDLSVDPDGEAGPAMAEVTTNVSWGTSAF